MRSRFFSYILTMVLTFSFAWNSQASCGDHSKNFKAPEWVTDQNNIMYEVNVLRTPAYNSAVPNGTFQAVKSNLRRLKDTLGITILWLMPVFDFGDGTIVINAKADTNSYYSCVNFKATHPPLGTIEDLADLVKHAHKLGIKVILDIPHNQTSWSNPLLTEHPDWFQMNERGEVVNAATTSGFQFWDTAQLKEQDAAKDLEDYMISVLKFWVKKTHIDGYRFDGGTGEWNNSFWARARKEVEKIKSVFFFAEETYIGQGVMQETYFNGAYGNRVFNALTTTPVTVEGIVQAMGYDKLNDNSAGLVRTNYSATHDFVFSEPANDLYGNFYFNELLLRYTMPDYLPQIAQGEDGGNAGDSTNNRINLFTNVILAATDFNSPTGIFLQELNQLRQENSALQNVVEKKGQHSFILSETDGQTGQEVFGFVRWNKCNRVIVLVNLSNEDIVYSPNANFILSKNECFRDALPAGTYRNFFYNPANPQQSDQALTVTNASPTQPAFTVTVPANGFKVFTAYEDDVKKEKYCAKTICNNRILDALRANPVTVEGIVQALDYDQLNDNCSGSTTNCDFSQPSSGDFYLRELLLNFTLPNVIQGEKFTNKYNTAAGAFLQKLNQLRKENSALQNERENKGQYSFILSETDGQSGQGVFGFVRWNKCNRVIVLVNLSNQDIVYNPDANANLVGRVFFRDAWLANNCARDVLPAGTYQNFFYDPANPQQSDLTLSVTNPLALVEALGVFGFTPPQGELAFTVTVPANGYKVFTAKAVDVNYVNTPVTVEEVEVALGMQRYNYAAVYPDLPSIYEVAVKPQENLSAFLAQLEANSSLVDSWLQNNTAVTFFAPQGNTLPIGFNLEDYVVLGPKTYDPEAWIENFDNPAPSLGLSTPFNVFETGVPATAVSGNSITLITNQPSFFAGNMVPQYNINGTVYNIVSDNITFVYRDSSGVLRQGLLNTVQ